MTHTRLASRIIVPTAILLLAGLPALAVGGLGEPQLDPSNGAGTAYTFFVQGTSKPLDPSAGQGATGKLNGTMTIFQGAGAGDFTADVLIDTNRDGNATGMLTCDGTVGSGRVGFSCNGTNEDGDNMFVMTLAKAVIRQGKVVLTAGKSLGFTDRSSLTFVFQGHQD